MKKDKTIEPTTSRIGKKILLDFLRKKEIDNILSISETFHKINSEKRLNITVIISEEVFYDF